MLNVTTLAEIDLGRQGENLARTVEIDVSSYLAAWPGAAISVLHRRSGDELPYSPVTTVENGVLRWAVTAADTAVKGTGKAEIHAFQGGVLCKSALVPTRVAASLAADADAEPPDAHANWVDRVTAAGAQAEQAAEDAIEAADRLTGLTAQVETLPPGSSATIRTENNRLIFGIPKGFDGEAHIDDAAASALTVWSSKHTLDKLCRRESQSGVIVEGRWAEGYPLDYRVDVAARQSGSGDPSPDNIRPIAGAGRVAVAVCAGNLLDYSKVSSDRFSANAAAGTIVKNISGYCGDIFTGTVGNATLVDDLSKIMSVAPDGPIYAAFDAISGAANTDVHINEINEDGTIAHQTILKPGVEKEIIPSTRHLTIRIVATEVGATVTGLRVSTKPGAVYAPYSGSTHAIALPETCYGGYIEGGKYVQTYGKAAFDGTEAWRLDTDQNARRFALPVNGLNATVNGAEKRCSHFTYQGSMTVTPLSFGTFYMTSVWLVINDNDAALADLNAWKAYLAAQHAAGTPVQIVYKLAAPIVRPLAMPTLCALDGQTTLYADSGAIAVSGAADPRADYEKLAQRVAALENYAIA